MRYDKGDYWNNRIDRDVFAKKGNHFLEIGLTGGGKTQGLIYTVGGIIANDGQDPRFNQPEIIAWFDLGKSADFLILSKFKKLRILYPLGCKVDIQLTAQGKETKNLQDIEQIPFVDVEEVWDLLSRDRINVICIFPFIREPVLYSKVVLRLFKDLIDRAFDACLPLPLAIIMDEMHRICPSEKNSFAANQAKISNLLQMNIEMIRSWGIRIGGSTQGFSKIKKGIRDEFHNYLARQGTTFTRDQHRLSDFNPHFEALKVEQGIWTFRNKQFSDDFLLPYYGNGEDLGIVRYIGIINIRRSRLPNATLVQNFGDEQ